MKEKINFYNNLLDELEFELVEVLEDNTVFKELEEWDSMSLLIVINFFKKETGINLTPEQIQNSRTFGELFNK